MRAAICLLGAMAAIPAAQGFELTSGVSMQYQSIAFWHDASAASPLLGSPTSVLYYPDLLAPALKLGASWTLGDWTIEPQVLLQGMGSGQFRDTDYQANGLAFSDTFSTASGGLGVRAQIRAVPGTTWQMGRVAAKPFIVASFEGQSLAAQGLTCGTVCAAPALSGEVTVMRHQIWSARAGVGAQGVLPIGETDDLTARVSASLGGLAIDDSHVLRTDLGPSPNIVYRTVVGSIDGELEYRRSLTGALSAAIVAGGGIDAGAGTATFGASTATPQTFPAGYSSIRLHVGLELTGKF